MSNRLPSDYTISPDRVPIPGKSITEGMSLEELYEAKQSEKINEYDVRPGTLVYRFAQAVLPQLLDQQTQGEEGDVPTNRS